MITVKATIAKDQLMKASREDWEELCAIEAKIQRTPGARCHFITKPMFFRQYKLRGPESLVEEWRSLVARITGARGEEL